MIKQTNIPLENKYTKKIDYILFLDSGFWRKREYDSVGNQIYVENSWGLWYKREYDSLGNQI